MFIILIIEMTFNLKNPPSYLLTSKALTIQMDKIPKYQHDLLV